MGLVSALLGAGRFLLGAARPAAAAAARAAPVVGRAALTVPGQVAIGLGAGALGAAAFGGGGAAAPGTPLSMAVAQGSSVNEIAGGRFAVTAPNGDFQVFNRNGQPVRATQIVQAGTRMPGGATIVSVRQGGSLIGITRRRPRRRFGAEIRNVRRTVQDAQALVRLCQPKKRRA